MFFSLNISGMELHNSTNNCWKPLGVLCERSDENQSPNVILHAVT